MRSAEIFRAGANWEGREVSRCEDSRWVMNEVLYEDRRLKKVRGLWSWGVGVDN